MKTRPFGADARSPPWPRIPHATSAIPIDACPGDWNARHFPPLSSDTPPVADPVANPLGMAGLEFVEFAAPVPEALAQRFEQLGFKAIARHVSKNVTLYRQGQMHFLINAG